MKFNNRLVAIAFGTLLMGKAFCLFGKTPNKKAIPRFHVQSVEYYDIDDRRVCQRSNPTTHPTDHAINHSVGYGVFCLAFVSEQGRHPIFHALTMYDHEKFPRENIIEDVKFFSLGYSIDRVEDSNQVNEVIGVVWKAPVYNRDYLPKEKRGGLVPGDGIMREGDLTFSVGGKKYSRHYFINYDEMKIVGEPGVAVFGSPLPLKDGIDAYMSPCDDFYDDASMTGRATASAPEPTAAGGKPPAETGASANNSSASGAAASESAPAAGTTAETGAPAKNGTRLGQIPEVTKISIFGDVPRCANTASISVFMTVKGAPPVLSPPEISVRPRMDHDMTVGATVAARGDYEQVLNDEGDTNIIRSYDVTPGKDAQGWPLMPREITATVIGGNGVRSRTRTYHLCHRNPADQCH